MINKKVLLRECKRHTARRVVNTPSVVLTGYPPHPDLAGGVPPGRVPPPGYPPTRVPPCQGIPPWLDLAGYPPPPTSCPMAFWEMLQSIMGYGYPPLRVWTDKQSEAITFPSYYARRAVNIQDTNHCHQMDNIPLFKWLFISNLIISTKTQ